MSHTILNVVRHQGGGYRLGVICREFEQIPRPSRIIVRGINSDPISIQVRNMYSVHGSIYEPTLNNWLSNHFPRTAEEDLWLLKFDFEVIDGDHVYTYRGPSRFRKRPYRRELLHPNGNRIVYQTIEELIGIAWQ